MTIICEQCGYENHMESDNCLECGKTIKKDETYLICGTCGISNPQSAKTCIGCQEPLSGKSTFVIDQDNKTPEEVEALIGHDSSNVTQSKKPKKVFKQFRKILKISGLITLFIGLMVGMVFIMTGQKSYYQAEEGFHYVTQTGILHVIDKKGKTFEVAYDVSGETQVMKYGKNIYYLTDNKLFLYDGNQSKLLSENVNSFKIHAKGEMVLYTVSESNDLFGDLYKYDGKETLRIDGHVGINRYIFNKKDVYYVTEITSDEDLGVLYMKRDTKSPVKVSEDVYSPIFSLKKDTVYFVRKDILITDKFDLYYVKSNKVTEISRNIKQIFVNPNEEQFIAIQEKNSVSNVLSIKKDVVKKIESEFDWIGFKTFNDIDRPILTMDEIKFFIHKSNGMNKMYDGSFKELGLFDAYWLSDDHNKIYTQLNNELSYSDLNEYMTNTISLARDAEVLEMSKSGETSVYEVNDLKYLLTSSYVKTLDANVSKTLISENEKYLIYLEGRDAYVLKSGAKEPVFLGGQTDAIMTLNSYVYTFVGNDLYRYKLGKFSSNKAIGTVRSWQELKLSE